MKNIGQFIFEASGKPSDLKKYKRTERKETVHFKGSDIYDLKDPGYDDEFTYFDGSGNGYIKDKKGHVYDVFATDRAGDSGYIAGGAHDYYVTIKKANGQDDFRVHGWIAIMSHGSNTECISDIKAGYYLEDYIAKYYNKYDHGDNFKELAEQGDKNAKSYEGEKAERLAQKKVDFETRYIAIPDTLSWEIVDGKFTIANWTLTNGSIEVLKKNRDEWLRKNKLNSWDKETNDNPEYQKMQEEINSKYKELKEIIMDVLEPVLIKKLQEVFKTKDLNSLSGLRGSFGYEKKFAHSKKSDWGYIMLAIDTKKKVFCVKDTANNKLVDDNIELKLNDNITIMKNKASDKMIELFTKVSEAWLKAKGRTKTEYVKNHWRSIYDSSLYGWGKHEKSQAQSKYEAGQAWEKMIRDMDFNYEGYDKKTWFTYSLSLVQVYVEGDMEPEGTPVKNPLENAEPSGEKKERGKDTKMSKKAYDEAYDKMKAWHEGTRKQNLSNCSDAKLKMNYKVCKELGYDKECDLLKSEAEKRGVVLESLIELNDFINIENEED